MAVTEGNVSGRIMKEIMEMSMDPPSNVSAGPKSEHELNVWSATIMGPDGTPYQGGIFQLEIILPANYPFSAPKISFLTKIFHCNIKGPHICLDILKNGWSPALTISKVLLSISSLLSDPNPDDPLDREAAELYIHNREEYNRRARDLVKKFASGDRQDNTKFSNV
ncbi:Ubiquitin-conjugating enzyme E2 D4 [Astathelohania contejeani]|uniref:Ubiquitin-conjugating enzyme E2 D4 n=1 Tax=Astathelohania contejeani TaxID=164912 RepID=A0ABQ7HZ66_9MICR|nr:Ubiquitin-conjugating enzyme E2 D4 [Thelohania contejeani]